MKIIRIILVGLATVLAPMACDKKQEPPVPTNEPVFVSPNEGKKPTKRLTRAERALQSLGLKRLEIDATALPPLPEAADPSGNVGLDTAYLRWERFWANVKPDSEDPENMPLGGDEGWRKTSDYIIWGYGRPEGILVGERTLLFDMGSDASDARAWLGKPYIPLTLKYDRAQRFPNENSFYSDGRDAGHRFDSLTRLHGVRPGNTALHQSTPMPYDLRFMRIAHNGVDISPLFSIRYKDYKEVVRTLEYSKWYWRDVRISDVGLDVLDWIFDSYFQIYPLTKDYPRFTIIFILKDGTVLSREVEHIL